MSLNDNDDDYTTLSYILISYVFDLSKKWEVIQPRGPYYGYNK